MNQIHACLLWIYHDMLRLWDGEPLIFKTVVDTCPCCAKHMEQKSSGEREIVTLAGGVTSIVEEYFVCPRCKDVKTGRRVINHSEFLRSVLPLKKKYGYDVEIEAGYLQYADNKQMGEIEDIFERTHNISLPQSQIHELGIRFLKHMVANHYLSAPALKNLFSRGCVYHIDATCEAGRGMELSVKEGWTGIVLGVWKIPTENEEIIRKHLRSTVELFGEPVAFVSDLGNGMMAACAAVIRELNLKSHQLICHTHFLKAVGKSIMDDTLKALKSQFRGRNTLADLNRFVKETGNTIKPRAADMRDFVIRWRESGAKLRIPGSLEGTAVLRSLAQWVISYGNECTGEGFPFELSHINLFDRCALARSSILGLIKNNRFHGKAARHAVRLQRILQSAVEDPVIRKTVQELKAMDAVFTELREVLRLEKPDVYKLEKDKKAPDKLEIVAKLKEETARFYDTLSRRLEEGSVMGAQADAIRTVLEYLDQYGPYLFGHFFVTYDDSCNIVVKLIERSNNIMENSFRNQKHQIRRRTGVKNLGFVFEHQFPAAAMMVNLDNPVYQKAVLDNKTRGDLVDLFASLDNRLTYRDTAMFQDDLEMVGGRLPSADKNIVSKSSFSEVVIMLSNEYWKSHCGANC